MNTLQQRVNFYLSGKPPEYEVLDETESQGAAVDSLAMMLMQAEEELESAAAKVARLKWELAKAQE